MAVSQFPGTPNFINIATAVGAAQTTTATVPIPAGSYIINTNYNGTTSFTFQIGSTIYQPATTTSFPTYISSAASSVIVTIASASMGWAPGTVSGAMSGVNFSAMVYGSVFVGGAGGVGSTSSIATSTDGISWTTRTNTNSNSIYGLAYNSALTEKYLAVGDVGSVSSSTDGTTWTARTSGFGTSTINACAAGTTTEKYVTVGSLFNGAAGIIKSSTDGISWTNRTSGMASPAGAVIFGTVWVVGGQQGLVSSSTDAVTWTARTSGAGTESIYGLFYLNNLYVYTSSAGRVASSTDGTTWTTKASPGTPFGSQGVPVAWGMTYFNSLYWLATGTGAYSSTDLITWTLKATGSVRPLANNGSLIVSGTPSYSSTGNPGSTITPSIIMQSTGSTTLTA